MPNKKIFEKTATIFWRSPLSAAFDTPRRRGKPLQLRPPCAPETVHGVGGEQWAAWATLVRQCAGGGVGGSPAKPAR